MINLSGKSQVKIKRALENIIPPGTHSRCLMTFLPTQAT
jgi:hypothetical protein